LIASKYLNGGTYMDVHGCTKSCEDVNCSLAVCAICCSRCDERKEENRGSVWMKRSLCLW